MNYAIISVLFLIYLQSQQADYYFQSSYIPPLLMVMSFPESHSIPHYPSALSYTVKGP